MDRKTKPPPSAKITDARSGADGFLDDLRPTEVEVDAAGVAELRQRLTPA